MIGAEDGECYDFALVDQQLRNLDTGETKELQAVPLRWMTDKSGHYVRHTIG